MSMKSFSQFIQDMGFVEYPFSTYTTENEKGKEDNLFVSPSGYAPIIQSFNQEQSLVLIGDRGTGKTAILLDFERNLDKTSTLLCSIDNFESLRLNFNTVDFYKILIRQLSIQLSQKLATEKYRLKNLTRSDRVLLSYLLFHFLPALSKKNLTEEIDKIQSNPYIRKIKKTYNKIRFIFNWGLSLGANVLDNYIAAYFNIPSTLNRTEVRDFLPTLDTDGDLDFENMPMSYELFEMALDLLPKLQFKRMVVILDKLDEDWRLNNNGEAIADFVRPILIDNKLLLSHKIQLVISMWSTPFNYLSADVRTQKHYCPRLKWEREDLVNVLNKRLQTYSSGAITSYVQLFGGQLNAQKDDLIFDLANGNPRDLWHLFNQLLSQQHQKNPDSSIIESTTIDAAARKFVLEFNYYEYYPKKPNARANSMDFYSYAALLLRLESEIFTRNQLNILAGTGGSTHNYVVGMERIGLIIKNSNTESSALTYRIKDPKVVYALKHGLRIEKR